MTFPIKYLYLFSCLLCLLPDSVIGTSISGNRWYAGCYNTKDFHLRYSFPLNIHDCTETCLALRFPYFGIVYNQTCSCLIPIDDHRQPLPETTCSKRCDGVPCSESDGQVSVFLNDLPTYTGLVFLNLPVVTHHVEQISILASSVSQNTTGISLGFSAMVSAQCTLNTNGTSNVTCDNSDTSISCGFFHTFYEPGDYLLDCLLTYPGGAVNVSTGFSVFLPAPTRLLLSIRSEPHLLPACIHQGTMWDSALDDATLVFVNESFTYQATLQYGLNTTFVWLFSSDAQEVVLDQSPCGVKKFCLTNSMTHTFTKVGSYRLTVTAHNTFGSTNASMHIQVLDKKIHSLSSRVDAQAVVGQPVSLHVDLITAELYRTFLHVAYGDGQKVIYDLVNYKVKDFYLPASDDSVLINGTFGIGCTFQLTLKHIYKSTGTYVISMKAYNNASEVSVNVTPSIQVLNQASNIDISAKFSATYSVGEAANFFLSGCPPDSCSGTIWFVSSSTVQHEGANFTHTFTEVGTYTVHANLTGFISDVTLSKTVTVQAPVTGLTLLSQNFLVLGTEDILELYAGLSEGSHVMYDWKIYGVEHIDTSIVYHSSTDHLSNATISFYTPGAYTVSIRAYNLVSSQSANISSVIVEETISHLAAATTDQVLPVGVPVHLKCLALKGTGVTYTVTFDPAEVQVIARANTTEVEVFHTYNSTGLYSIHVSAENNKSSEEVTIPVRVESQLPELRLVTYGPRIRGKSVTLAVENSKGQLMSQRDFIFNWANQDFPSVLPFTEILLESDVTPVHVMIRNQVSEQNLTMNIEVQLISNSLATVNHPRLILVNESVTFMFENLPTNLSMAMMELHDSNVSVAMSAGRGSYSTVFTEPSVLQVLVTYPGHQLRTTLAVLEGIDSSAAILGPSVVSLHSLNISNTWEVSPGCFGCTFEWDFGTRELYTLPYAKVFFEYGDLVPGDYLVNCTIVHASGTARRLSSQVQVKPLLQDVFVKIQAVSFNQRTVIAMSLVGDNQFIDATINFGDGTLRTLRSIDFSCQGCLSSCEMGQGLCVTHQYVNPGRFLVTLSVTNNVTVLNRRGLSVVEEPLHGGSISTSYKMPIVVNSVVTHTLLLDSGSNVDIQWEAGDGAQLLKLVMTDRGSEGVFRYTKAGTFHVSAMVKQPTLSGSNLTSSLHVPIIVAVPIERALFTTAQNQSFFKPLDPMLFLIQIEPAVDSYGVDVWVNFGDGSAHGFMLANCSGQSCFGELEHIYRTVGNFSPIATVVSPLGNATFPLSISSVSIQFGIEGLRTQETCVYGANIERFINEGTTTMFNAVISNGTDVKFSWDFGDGMIGEGQAVIHKYFQRPPGDIGYFAVVVTAENGVSLNIFIFKLYILMQFERIEILFNNIAVDPSVPVNISADDYDTYTVGYRVYPTGAAAPRCKWVPFNNDFQYESTTRLLKTDRIRSSRYNLEMQIRCSNELADDPKCMPANRTVSEVASPVYKYNIEVPLRNLDIIPLEDFIRGKNATVVIFRSRIECTWSANGSFEIYKVVRETVSFVFPVAGVYNITAYCHNSISNASATELIEVFDKLCKFDRSTFVYPSTGEPVYFTRSEHVFLFASADFTCELFPPRHLEYFWNITEDSYNSSVMTLQTKDFHSPPLKLPIGNYTASCTVHVGGTSLLTLKDKARITIVSAPVVAKIRSGLLRFISSQPNLTLDASQSYDPECPKPCRELLKFTWECSIRGSGHQCFLSPWTMDTSSILNIHTSYLKQEPGLVFNFTVTVWNSSRNALSSAYQFVQRDRPNVPPFEVTCDECEASDYKISQTQRYRFKSTCEDCSHGWLWTVEIIPIRQLLTNFASNGRCEESEFSVMPQEFRANITYFNNEDIYTSTTTTLKPATASSINISESTTLSEGLSTGSIPSEASDETETEDQGGRAGRLPPFGPPIVSSSDNLAFPGLYEKNIKLPEGLLFRPRYQVHQDDTNPEYFLMNNSYLRQNVTYLVTGRRGSAAVRMAVQTKLSPLQGTCRVQNSDFNDKSTIMQEFGFRLFSCISWLMISYGRGLVNFVDLTVTVVRIQTRVGGPWYLQLTAATSSPVQRLYLPSGDPAFGYTVTTAVTVRGRDGEETPVCLKPVTVLPRPFTNGTYTQALWNETFSPFGHLQTLRRFQDAKAVVASLRNLAEAFNGPHLNKSETVEDKLLRRNASVYFLKMLCSYPILTQDEAEQAAWVLYEVTRTFQWYMEEELLRKIVELLGEVTSVFELSSATKQLDAHLYSAAVQAACHLLRIEELQTGGLNQTVHHLKLEGILRLLLWAHTRYHLVVEPPVYYQTPSHVVLSQRQPESGPTTLRLPHVDTVINLPAYIMNHSGNQLADDCFTAYAVFSRAESDYAEPQLSRANLRGQNEGKLSLTLQDCNSERVGSPRDIRLRGELVHISMPNRRMEPVTYWLNRTDANFHFFKLDKANGSVQDIFFDVEFDVAEVYDYSTEVFLKFFKDFPTINEDIFRNPDRVAVNAHDQSYVKFFFSKDDMEDLGSGYLVMGVLDHSHSRERIEVWMPRKYRARVWNSKCESRHDDESSDWSTQGCSVSAKSTDVHTLCTCSHLSHFRVSVNSVLQPSQMLPAATGVVALSHVRRVPITDLIRLAPSKCWIVFIVVCTAYILLFIICYLADSKHPVQETIIPVIDNSPDDTQKYIITLETGNVAGAGTTAKVSMVLHGEDGMSETRELVSSSPGYPVFQRNSRDTFLLTLPKSIGRIWRIQLWHNNEGNSPGWFIKHVTVKDWTSKEIIYFVCNKWLAVEEDDGKVDAEFMFSDIVRGGFMLIFKCKAPQYFSDYHLWLSLWTKPTYSHFSRLERLTCLLMIVNLYLLISAWFLDNLGALTQDVPSITDSNYHKADSKFYMSWQNVVLGLFSSLIVYPVFLLTSLFFRRSRVFRRKPNQSMKPSPEKTQDHDHSPPISDPKIEQILLHQFAQKFVEKQVLSSAENMVKPEETMDLADLVMINKHILNNLQSPKQPKTEDVIVKPAVPKFDNNFVSPSYLGSSVGSRRQCYMPYNMRLLGWLICLAVSGGALAWSISISLYFDCEFVWHWVKIAFFAVVLDCFFIQPVCILMKALFTAVSNRNNFAIMQYYTDRYEDDILYLPSQPPYMAEKDELSRGIAARQRSRELRLTRPPQEKQLIAARKKTMKEKKFWYLVSEVVELLIIVAVLLVIAFSRDTWTPWCQNKSIKEVLLANATRTSDGGPGVSLMDVHNTDEFWQWAAYDLTSFLFGEKRENLGSSIIVHNMSQLRQVRVRPTDWAADLTSHSDWYSKYSASLSKLAARDECRWLGNTVETCNNASVKHDYAKYSSQWGHPAFSSRYESHAMFDNFTYSNSIISLLPIMWGKLATYYNTGFNKTWIGKVSKNSMSADIETLRNSTWIDSQTRAVFFETTVYNGATKLFSSVVIMFEVSPSGTWLPEVFVSSVLINKYRHSECSWVTAADLASLIAEMVLIILILWRAKNFIMDLVHFKLPLFLRVWKTAEFIFLLIALAYLICFVYRFEIVDGIYPSLIATHPHDPNYKFVSVAFLALWEDVLKALLGIMLFILMCSSLRLFRYVRLFAKFGNVLKLAGQDLRMFSVTFFVFVAAFTCAGMILFTSFHSDFADGWLAVTAVVEYLSGNFAYEELAPYSPVFAGLYMVLVSGLGAGFLFCLVASLLRYHYHVYSQDKIFAMSIPEAWHLICNMFNRTDKKKQTKDPHFLPPEFALAEMEYQVEEMLYKMNCLSGEHSLPARPAHYLSDCTDPDTFSSESEPYEGRLELPGFTNLPDASTKMHKRGRFNHCNRSFGSDGQDYTEGESSSIDLSSYTSGHNSSPSSPSSQHRIPHCDDNLQSNQLGEMHYRIPYHPCEENDIPHHKSEGQEEVAIFIPDEITYHGLEAISHTVPDEIPYFPCEPEGAIFGTEAVLDIPDESHPRLAFNFSRRTDNWSKPKTTNKGNRDKKAKARRVNGVEGHELEDLGAVGCSNSGRKAFHNKAYSNTENDLYLAAEALRNGHHAMEETPLGGQDNRAYAGDD